MSGNTFNNHDEVETWVRAFFKISVRQWLIGWRDSDPEFYDLSLI